MGLGALAEAGIVVLTAKEFDELDGLFERLYEDNVSQKISDARFAKMSQRYEQEQGENAKRRLLPFSFP